MGIASGPRIALRAVRGDSGRTEVHFRPIADVRKVDGLGREADAGPLERLRLTGTRLMTQEDLDPGMVGREPPQSVSGRLCVRARLDWNGLGHGVVPPQPRRDRITGDQFRSAGSVDQIGRRTG